MIFLKTPHLERRPFHGFDAQDGRLSRLNGGKIGNPAKDRGLPDGS